MLNEHQSEDSLGSLSDGELANNNPELQGSSSSEKEQRNLGRTEPREKSINNPSISDKKDKILPKDDLPYIEHEISPEQSSEDKLKDKHEGVKDPFWDRPIGEITKDFARCTSDKIYRPGSIEVQITCDLIQRGIEAYQIYNDISKNVKCIQNIPLCVLNTGIDLLKEALTPAEVADDKTEFSYTYNYTKAQEAYNQNKELIDKVLQYKDYGTYPENLLENTIRLPDGSIYNGPMYKNKKY